VSDEVLFKFLKSLGLHEEEKNKKVATAAAATAMDPELLDLFEGDAKYGLNTSIGGAADPGSEVRCLFDPWIRDPG
jgi:hypothetical protein